MKTCTDIKNCQDKQLPCYTIKNNNKCQYIKDKQLPCYTIIDNEI